MAHAQKAAASQRQGAPNPIQLQKFLGGLDYPAGKQDIIDKARQEGAGSNILDTLERLPEQEYASPIAISREVGKLD